MAAEEVNAHQLLLPECKGVTLDHLSAADLRALANLAGVDTAGAERRFLLETPTHRVQTAGDPDWTLKDIPVGSSAVT